MSDDTITENNLKLMKGDKNVYCCMCYFVFTCNLAIAELPIVRIKMTPIQKSVSELNVNYTNT